MSLFSQVLTILAGFGQLAWQQLLFLGEIALFGPSLCLDNLVNWDTIISRLVVLMCFIVMLMVVIFYEIQ